ncbi:sulfurtransferase complex subunit TusD [Endozoicomonas numazuensis]|uniref:Sulfurtransferase n=1 Tax=Endozoicomonas numazuensis TaxID=1137799 RepID=A0A081NCU9_9GAMM|nr:sulfurtransferase complex subunit TusD [Endozoicomonas numazuensis]KEQ16272.1 sulfurtransferase [Endozoicomonas numazuensis]
MKYALAVYGAASTGQSSLTALSFARALLVSGHEVMRVFFYQEGVHNATSLTSPPQDEQNLPEQWQRLIAEHDIDAVVCIAAALRRGVVSVDEAERYELSASNLREGYELSGLGQLLEAAVEADRLVTFGD